MRRALQRVRRDQGQAVVELVLILPLVLVLVFAIVEFGVALNARLTVQNAASEGARYGSLGSPPGDASCAANTARGRALSASGGMLDCSEITITYPGGVGSATRGDEVAVHISHEYTAVTPLGGLLQLIGAVGFPDTLTLSACSSGRLEQAPSPSVSHGGSSC
ncbi:MAG: pilus assembly protein [Dehalococcoidia bacterium]|nr:pilus assembly protein [Dehalococcoidia bacterium]MCA9849809.1 pilus assembly protein [Dehalococcoidia bacterium]MCA9856825.1 pilus assembly protein [Dehalococcoidia bacterium]MCB9484037.1 pilus assembly protein [Dehalococcoidia bacterium]MCB9490496.1 pilus assembly protein [Dehalococcoidia bacterium]